MIIQASADGRTEIRTAARMHRCEQLLYSRLISGEACEAAILRGEKHVVMVTPPWSEFAWGRRVADKHGRERRVAVWHTERICARCANHYYDLKVPA